MTEPVSPALPSHRERPVDGEGPHSATANTHRAYAADWRHLVSWCRRQGLEHLPPNPKVIGAYLTACAQGDPAWSRPPNAASTIERRLSAISWNYVQRGYSFDRADPDITAALAGIRHARAASSDRKEVLIAEDIIAMTQTLERGTLRGLRDRAILLLGFAGGLRRSEIVGLDVGSDQSEDGRGWIEFFEDGLLIVLRARNGWRELEIGPGSSDATCPVVALQTWLKFARINRGPVFRRVTDQGRQVGAGRLTDRQVARLVQRTVLAAGLKPELSTSERRQKFSGQSLRASLAPLAELHEHRGRGQPGPTSNAAAGHSRRRRNPLRVNLTRVAGL